MVAAATAVLVVVFGGAVWTHFSSSVPASMKLAQAPNRSPGPLPFGMITRSDQSHQGTVLLPSAKDAASGAIQTLPSPAANPTVFVPGTPNQHVALVIGINQWLAEPALPQLSGAVNDAKSVAELWRKVGYTVIEMTPDSAMDDQPTRANILKRLAYYARLGQGDSLTIYWSGHGTMKNGKAYLMPMDARLANVEASGLSLDDLSNVLETAHATFKNLGLWVDVCRLGADKTTGKFIEALSRSASKWELISSCSDGQFAGEICDYSALPWRLPEAQKPHGLFTLCLLASRYGQRHAGGVKSPADINGDGIISRREAFLFAEHSIAQLASLHQQTDATPAGTLPTPQMFGHTTKDLTDAPFCQVEEIPVLRSEDTIGPDQILPPPVDSAGRFVVYSDMAKGATLPFIPYGWMWGNGTKEEKQVMTPQSVSQMMQLNLNCATQPYGGHGSCVSWQVHWAGKGVNGQSWDATWAAIGWFTGNDLPAWWAQPGDNRAYYYNLESPRRFRVLRFAARSPSAGTRLLVKVGILSRDADGNPLVLGDSLAYPIEKRFLLGAEWQQFVVPLNPYRLPPTGECVNCPGAREVCAMCGNNPVNPKRNNLERICSLAFVVEKLHQADASAPVQVYLDNVFFE